MEWFENKLSAEKYTPVTRSQALCALDFWRTAPFYSPSPLVNLRGAASALGLGEVYLKDEGRRFGPGAFKLMGAGYAMARSLGAGSWDEAVHAKRKTCFYTATDGNHGRAVAWCASRFGQRAAVLMPSGSAEARRAAIAAEDADVTVTDMGYDDCVRRARELAGADPNGILLQDTTLPGYETLPLEIMRGYGAIAAELEEQLPCAPTHVILQAGVGSFAGALSSALDELFPQAAPVFLVTETAAAPCLMLSAEAGETRACAGEIRTIMAGLACGEPCIPGLRSLLGRARFFTALPDMWAAEAMRALARPLDGDEIVVAGESGAAGFGLLLALMRDASLSPLREAARLGPDSRVLVFSTETATDPINYKKIVGNIARQTPSKDV
ncbi:MAG TPA: diaminopropionate ammonia-lyase [Candidatus Scatomorpha merdigallinarum]|nr:diaminopropionate ammonia-lyase [Candidatus Scatomorpha merdigallinarum]